MDAVKILMVDQNLSFIDSLKLHLRKAGFQVSFFTYRNLSSFYEEGRKEKYDFYILDNSADISLRGIGICKSLVSKDEVSPERCILLVSHIEDVQKEAKSLGIKVFERPVSPKVLGEYIEGIIKKLRKAK